MMVGRYNIYATRHSNTINTIVVGGIGYTVMGDGVVSMMSGVRRSRSGIPPPVVDGGWKWRGWHRFNNSSSTPYSHSKWNGPHRRWQGGTIAV